MKPIFWTFLLCTQLLSAQAFDFGGGATVSVGLQDEWAVNMRAQYHQDRAWSYLAAYNLFFRRDVTTQNTETFSEFGASVNYKLLTIEPITILGGLGYTLNNFEMRKNHPDTSNLFFETGNFNHGAELKFLGYLPIGKAFRLFAEFNLKSFGRRYDSFTFGLVYRIQASGA